MIERQFRAWRALTAALALALVLPVAALGESDALMLWEGEIAPYTEQSPEQAQPSLTAFEAKDAKIAVVICPGGGYRVKSRYEGNPVARRMCKGGISAYVLDYRVRSCHYLAPITDAQRAIRLVRSLGYDYVGIMGFSAGGHLALTAATFWDRGNPSAEDPLERMSCRPDFFACGYAVTSFARYPEKRLVTSLLGDLAEDPVLLHFFSPVEHIDAETPSGFIWHCTGDKYVSPEHSMLLAQALTDAGVPYELHIYPGGNHGIGLASRYPIIRNWPQECLRFIKQICKE